MTSRRAGRLHREIAASTDQVERLGRHARADSVAPDSFYTHPHQVPALSSFNAGVATALRDHLLDQGLTELADQIRDLERLGSRLNRSKTQSDTVSEIVYEMH